ncbi:MAG: DNA alkylation repair protein [Candidatus Ranarchaeia archaeon]
MDVEGIIALLKAHADPHAADGMRRYGIVTEQIYGVSIPQLRKIAKNIGRNHGLAQRWWKIPSRETRILASMIANPLVITEAQVDMWVSDLDNWEICDQCCMNLFEKTSFAYQKCIEWSSREKEFVKRAGFALMARMAVSDKTAGGPMFERFLPIIKRESLDSRKYVKKAVNWALRQIGKRNLLLNEKATQTAYEIMRLDSKSAMWIAKDALRELTNQKTRDRISKKDKSSMSI